jgi:glycosyltransferase involved in cell wall biosynthesis
MASSERVNEMNIAMVGTFPPCQCGIATFTSDFAQALRSTRGIRDTPIIAVSNSAGPYEYPELVEYQIRQGLKNDYIHAAEYLNYSDVSLVSIQHEYGIYGGDDGVFVLDLCTQLTKPFVVTLHTVLEHPSERQRSIVRTMAKIGGKLVVMSNKAVGLLDSSYGIAGENVCAVIPHGIPDIPQGEREAQKARLGLKNKRVILTFGLLSPGKGIEEGIRALAIIVTQFPNAVYLVVGATHPEIKQREGEKYRHSLESLAERLGVRGNLIFRNTFLKHDELIGYLQSADVLLTPYTCENQITSGVLAYAMGAGAAPVSTPFWHAQELLDDGRGCLFPFGNSEALSLTINSLFEEPDKLARVQNAAYNYSRTMTWPHVGSSYSELFSQCIDSYQPSANSTTISAQAPMLPELRLDHLRRLTDDTGVIQHARYTLPRRSSGYCVDDNARALVVALHAHKLIPSRVTDRLITNYLSYIEHAQRMDGAFHNFMLYSRDIDPSQSPQPSDDCVGRALWGLGEASHLAPDEGRRQLATELFNISISQSLDFGPRGASLSILGLDAYLKAHPGHEVATAVLKGLANSLVERFNQEATGDWQWFESSLTYDNGLLPLALFKAYGRIHDSSYLRIARSSLGFLEHICFEEEHLALVGNSEWHNRDGERSMSDEQPLDAASLVLAYRGAYLATGNHQDKQRMRQCFEWFLGNNRLGVPLYDFISAGCRDGLGLTTANENQGAESTISFLIALIAMLDVVSEMPVPENECPIVQAELSAVSIGI